MAFCSTHLVLSPSAFPKRRVAVNANRAQICVQSTDGCYGSKKKVVFILGATTTGKTKLAIDLATSFDGEIVNSDKIQVYRGLDILTNKTTKEERQGISHHLLDFIEDPTYDFTSADFVNEANIAITQIVEKGKLPIIAGGSNSYIRALVDNMLYRFEPRFDPCFIWVDLALPALYRRSKIRVDLMVESGLRDEVNAMFSPGLDYKKGLWRAIGFSEMEKYCMAEIDPRVNEETKERLFRIAIMETKENTCKLVDSQLEKIRRFRDELGWNIHRMDATSVAGKTGEAAEIAWRRTVLEPSVDIVNEFINGEPRPSSIMEDLKRVVARSGLICMCEKAITCKKK